MKEELSKEKSLELITGMIAATKGNVGQGAFHMLLWGWAVITMSLSHFFMMRYEVIEHPELVWFLCFPTFAVSMIVGYKRGRNSRVTSYLDIIYKWIWVAFAFAMMLMIFFLAGKWEIINPMILMLAGYATFLSGKLLKFKPMVYGAIAFWVWAVIGYFSGPMYGLLVTAAAIFTGYLLPGILLQRRSDAA